MIPLDDLEETTPDEWRTAARQLVVTTAAASGGPRRGRRVAVTVALTSALVVGGSAVAWSALRPNAKVTEKDEARCYTLAEYHEGDTFPGTTIASAVVAGDPHSGQVRDAVATCSALYRQGFLKVGRHGVISDPPPGRYPVPRLVACVMPDGAAAVFPGSRTSCKALGLPRAR